MNGAGIATSPCKARVRQDPKPIPKTPPVADLTAFEPALLARIFGLEIDPDAVDDLLAMLKQVPPEQRDQYLNSVFNETSLDDADPE